MIFKLLVRNFLVALVIISQWRQHIFVFRNFEISQEEYL